MGEGGLSTFVCCWVCGLGFWHDGQSSRLVGLLVGLNGLNLSFGSLGDEKDESV